MRLAGHAGDLALLSEGVRAGDRVIVEGVLKVQPGVKVKVVVAGAPEAAAGQEPKTAGNTQ